MRLDIIIHFAKQFGGNARPLTCNLRGRGRNQRCFPGTNLEYDYIKL